MPRDGRHFALVQRQLDRDQQRLRPQPFRRRVELRLAQPALGHRQIEQRRLLALFNQRVARRVNHQHPAKTVLAAR